MAAKEYYELYRRSSIGLALIDTLDEMVEEGRMEPQLAMKVVASFDRIVADVLADKVKARLSFKGHLDTYRFCDEVWTFLIKDVNFKLDNQSQVHAEKVKIRNDEFDSVGRRLYLHKRQDAYDLYDLRGLARKAENG